MLSIYELKPAFQALLRPITKTLAGIGVSANQVTLSAALLCIVTGIALLVFSENHHLFLLVPIILFVRMGLNAIDGMLAREHNMQSNLGAQLNELSDVVSDAFVYLPFALIPTLSPFAVVCVVCLAMVAEMAGLVGLHFGAERRYDGPMGKSDRAVVFGVLGLCVASGYTPQPWLDYILWLVCALSAWTIYNRCRNALRSVS